MVCVKETATLPRLMLVNTVPSMCPTASGAILPSCSRKRKSCRAAGRVRRISKPSGGGKKLQLRFAARMASLTCAAESLGAGWSLVAHMRKMSREPKASWKAVMVYGSGSGSAPRTCNGGRARLVFLIDQAIKGKKKKGRGDLDSRRRSERRPDARPRPVCYRC